MIAFYNMIQDLNPNHHNVAMTVIEGEHFGDKAIFSNKKLVWESKESGFFSQNIEILQTVDRNCVMETAGQKIYCELLGSQKKIVICGGGHVSIPIIKMALMTGFHVTVLEDRPKFANNARKAGATEVFCEPFDEGLAGIEGDIDTFFVIVTRGHRYDQVCLESIVKKPHAYIGMIGSKLRVKKVKAAILENGADQKVVDDVFTPIGLDIGAETPEEIAIAIMAEIIDVKNKKRQSMGYSKEILRAILDRKTEEEHKVLITIVERKGSAPRGIGTKMVVCPDGTCIGTIGGGCVEADIFRKALLMLKSEDMTTRIWHVDMTGRDAEDEGMVCGGVIDVLMERI
ncbi:MAG: XdhC family protein [Oliverpabstia sp.]